MWERAKTGILTTLVILSLILTFTIWTSIPTNGPIEQPTVLSTISYGPEKTINQLIFPDQLVVHFGQNKHTVLRPFTNGYNYVLKELQKSSIYDMKPIRFSSAEWKQVVSGHSIEMQFNWDVPFDIVSRIFPGIKLIETKPSCRTIFINADANFQNAQVIFMNSNYTDTSSYQAYMNISSESLKSLFSQLESTEPTYLLFGSNMAQSFYLPKDPQSIPIYTYQLKGFDPEQLTNSFFVDPSITKKINERDGSFIKTDGSRGVSFNFQSGRIQYTDPLTDWKDEQVGADKQISQAITFANDHGGVPEDSQLFIGDSYLVGPDTIYTIRQLLNGIPIDDDLSTIEVHAQGSEVTEFDRSLIYLGSQIKKTPMQSLPTQQLLARMEQQHVSIGSISHMSLVYHAATVTNDQILLQPVYLVLENTGVTLYIDAISGNLLERGGNHGLE